MFIIGCKVKCTFAQALRLCTGRTALRGSRGIALPFHDHGTRRGEGSVSRPGGFLPLGKTRYPLYRGLGGPQASLDRCGKFRPPSEFDPRTVQPVASRYTDWATRPTRYKSEIQKCTCSIFVFAFYVLYYVCWPDCKLEGRKTSLDYSHKNFVASTISYVTMND